MSPRFAAVVPALLCLSVACVRVDPRTEATAKGAEAAPEGPAARPEDGDAQEPDGPEAEAEAAPAPILLVSDPAALIALEGEHGLGLAALHEHPEAVATADYGAGPLRSIAASLKRTLEARRREDPKHTGVGLRYAHRQFDLDWLAAEDTRFELIGVVNRLDREVFAPADAYAGETRLIYRLAYTREQRGVEVDSRLPMTVNVVYRQPSPTKDELEAGGGHRLRAVAARWQAPAGLGGEALASWLRARGHALDPSLLTGDTLEAVEIDVQTERWPATVRPNMAGHAEYLLQVFHRDLDEPASSRRAWRPAPLENTPDVAALARDAKAREALLTWLRAPEQREALDQGTLVVPERFLDREATSVTPRGFARRANRPWSQLFSPDDFADYDFEGMRRIRSPRALLRRLDGLSCQGCHESRSIAGFHLLGEERDPDRRVDALAVFTSPHLEGELERRAVWHAALLADEAPSEFRELSEHERNRGAWGTHCGLGDPGFADWTCDEHLRCMELGDAELGTCLGPGPAYIGGPCELGEIRANDDHHRDGVRLRPEDEQVGCAGWAACNSNGVGFPEGMCAGGCENVDQNPDAACGVIPNLQSFNNCLAAKQPFAKCIEKAGFPASMRACSSEAPCRDDYICARSGSEAGVCLPPYFLFQLRVDGHPS